MRLGWAWCLIAAGCGRIGFDGGDASSSTDASSSRDADETYAREVITDNPLAYWRLDETSGTTALDATGHGHDMTLTGTFSSAPGIVGGALQISAGGYSQSDGGYFGRLDLFPFNGNSAFTLECWLYPDLLEDTWRQLFQTDNWDQQVRREGYTIEYRLDHIHIVRRRDDVGDSASAYGALAAGRWHHIAATYDGATLRLYVDGTERDAVPSTLAIASAPNTPFSVSDAEFTVTGRLDDCAVYDHALSAQRLSQHHAIPAP